MMMEELQKISRTPDTPLTILQAELEGTIQLVTQTLFVYKRCLVRLPQGRVVPLPALGYEQVLCNMALVNAVAAWEGFKRNITHEIRANGHRFLEKDLDRRLGQTTTYGRILEPVDRRDCIAHNLARVDCKYKEQIRESQLPLGQGVDIDMPYLKEAIHSFFQIGVEVTRILVLDRLLAEQQQETLGNFQRDPVVKQFSPP